MKKSCFLMFYPQITEAYLGPCQTSMMKSFCEKRKTPSKVLDRVLDTPLNKIQKSIIRKKQIHMKISKIGYSQKLIHLKKLDSLS